MERWIKNVTELTAITSADLFLVDNSPTPDYIEKVKGYCEKYGVKNYKIEHLEVDQELGIDVRIEMSHEMIRQYILSSQAYDAWFSWECDVLIPADSLTKLIGLMEMGKFMMVAHNCWARDDSTKLNTDMGLTLIGEKCLKNNWLPPKIESQTGSDIYGLYENCPERILKNGGNFIEVFGVITSIYHLSE